MPRDLTSTANNRRSAAKRRASDPKGFNWPFALIYVGSAALVVSLVFVARWAFRAIA